MIMPARRLRQLALLAALVAVPTLVQLAAAADSATATDRDGIDFFEKRVRPVLIERCYKCHSAKSEKLRGNLKLDSREGWLKGGDLGAAVVPGNPDDSPLIQAVRWNDEDFRMPPDKRLPDEQVADLLAWVKRGAPGPATPNAVAAPSPPKIDIEAARQRWPFAKVTKPAVPSVRDTVWPRNDIDRFILAKLEERGLRPAGDSEKRTLIRRATFDLVGLPPTPGEVEAFLNDNSPEAFAKVVDRLLASSHYGERWGRHWLDVVRYADTAGDNSDYPIPQMYRYRNWVIDAFNRDFPYDQFIREQLSGDLLGGDADAERQQRIVATGFIALARRFGSTVDDYPQHLTIEDTIDNLGRAFLGLSLNCARCHDHKFDPVTMHDYYGLYGIFHSTRYPWPGIELDKQQRDVVPLAPQAVVDSAMQARADKKRDLDQTVKRLEAEKVEADKQVQNLSAKLDDARKQSDEDSPEVKRADEAVAAAKRRRDDIDKELQRVRKERDNFDRSPLPFDTAYAVGEGKRVEDVCIQMKGDPQRLGDKVPRHFLTVLGGQALSDGEAGSGRRQLADWIASPDNSLTARVLVNRLWQHHFGRGIVPTPNDFGRQGQPPTHPELLDFLARRFADVGWSIKGMHREMMLSRTYQMASSTSPSPLGGEGRGEGAERRMTSSADKAQRHAAPSPPTPHPQKERGEVIDPRNELLWQFWRRRLDAEAVRDSLLVLGGQLDRTPGGPHPFPEQTAWDFTQHKPFRAVYDTNRRSVYLMTQRIQRHPYLAIFDGPDTGASTAARTTSTTTLQSLYLLNDPFVHEQAKHFAARLLAARDDDRGRIELAYQLAFSRPPTAAEIDSGVAFLKQATELLQAGAIAASEQNSQAWQSFARSLFRLNEFVYVN
jgi:mono/diheme cytochrome c family protein